MSSVRIDILRAAASSPFPRTFRNPHQCVVRLLIRYKNNAIGLSWGTPNPECAAYSLKKLNCSCAQYLVLPDAIVLHRLGYVREASWQVASSSPVLFNTRHQ